MDSDQNQSDSFGDPLDISDEYSYGEPFAYSDNDTEDVLYLDSQPSRCHCSQAENIAESGAAKNNEEFQTISTSTTESEEDDDHNTYFRCTGGREWPLYTQAIDCEYGDYIYDTQIDEVSKYTHCHSDDSTGTNKWCDHFRICEETLRTTMTLYGWASCDCRTTSLSSLWTTRLEQPIVERAYKYNFKPIKVEYTPVHSDGLLLNMDMGHVPQCPKVNPFKRPHSDTFPTLQSLCVQTVAEARPCSIAIKDLELVPGTVIATNRPLCQLEHHTSLLDCFEWTTSQDFHDNRNLNVHLFYFQPPHPLWISQLPPSLSKRVMRYYVNRHLLYNVSIEVFITFKWEELSPQQLYNEITKKPKSKFLHIYYCKHAHPEYDPRGSDDKLHQNMEGCIMDRPVGLCKGYS